MAKTAPSRVSSTSSKNSSKNSPQSTPKNHDSFGLPVRPVAGILKRATAADVRTGKRGFVFFVRSDEPSQTQSTKKSATKSKAAASAKSNRSPAFLKAHLSRWQIEKFESDSSDVRFFHCTQGPVWVVMLQSDQATHEAQSKLAKSSYAKVRDQVGSCLIQSLTFDLDRLVFELHGLSQQEEQGIAVGLEVAAYSYADQRGHTQRKAKHLPRLFLAKSSREKEAPALSDRQLKEASLLGLAINQARHLVNLPPNDLQPQSYAQLVQSLFADSSTATVEVWSGQKLHDEKMNLLLAVGSGAAHAPCLVHIRYRPKAKADVQLQRPIALVGKGITFDSGGLDIKPSSGMRLMKKDMGGSAAVVAILKWAESVALAQPLDGYIALAENAIDSQAFRPSDVIQARSGLTIEIDNTDAEGRLVLADALDVAVTVTSEDRPSHVIDVATLTGAGKVALGTEIASLFSNHDELASALFQSGLATGDWMWRTPLFDGYRSQLKSNFADHVNSASSGFGGAITAALFLEFFTRDIPWAHLDIYAWKDAASGAWSEGGGSGQPVQALAHFLLNHSAQQSAASNS